MTERAEYVTLLAAAIQGTLSSPGTVATARIMEVVARDS